jgi:hypothetical protein
MKLNRILLVFFCCCASIYSYAQISGRVIDKKTKQPIPFAVIENVGKLKGVLTKDDGTFTIDDASVLNGTQSKNTRVLIKSLGGYWEQDKGILYKGEQIYCLPKFEMVFQ